MNTRNSVLIFTNVLYFRTWQTNESHTYNHCIVLVGVNDIPSIHEQYPIYVPYAILCLICERFIIQDCAMKQKTA